MKYPINRESFPCPIHLREMNPYLEQPEYWSDFHNQLVAAIARYLVPRLVPKYRVVTDKWVYKIAGSTAIAIGRPDVSVHITEGMHQRIQILLKDLLLSAHCPNPLK